MCDIFTGEDVCRLFKGKSVLFLGDSIMRNIYKDLLYMSQEPQEPGRCQKYRNQYIPSFHMQRKGESSFCGDKLLYVTELNAARNYEEERDYYYQDNDMQFSFMFITRCYSQKLEEWLKEYPHRYGSYPEVIMINSALWDVNRYGPHGPKDFQTNMEELCLCLQRCLHKSPHTQVIWMTTPPISTEIRGGVMIQQLQFQALSMRFNILEANSCAARVMAAYGYDVLDMHYFMCNQIHRRAADGVHWNANAVRMQVNIFLTHFCQSRDLPLPGKVDGSNLLMRETMESVRAAGNDYRFPPEIPQKIERKIVRPRYQRDRR